LRMVFRERGETDFTEISLAAAAALGGEDEPTDLALALDHRIQHLLIDEFQDTSVTQRDLIAKLVAGWEPGDGRTLFLVGDPMQSIFRFREAEVGLFAEAAGAGIGAVRLEPLRLETNFRSGRGIVEWVNAAFAKVLLVDDVAAGAVRFAASSAVNPSEAGPEVSIHPFFDKDENGEAARVVELIGEIRRRDSGASIAILVRARTHLPAILRALRRAALRYRAVEVDELGERAVTRDLQALTRALLHPADRVAWLAILRAPWCGLTLADLHALAGEAPRDAIWELLCDARRVERLSPDGQARLGRIVPAIAEALGRRGALLRPWVEACWTALGGPACATEAGDFESALAFLDLLETLDDGGSVDFEELAAETKRLFAPPDPQADGSLQAMTIHKAKGLEFDVVLVPGLGREIRDDEPKLLAWLERPSAGGGTGLVLAPVKSAGAKQDGLSRYVKRIEQRKNDNEAARLLYVASTRARKQLHLLGAASRTRKGLKAEGLLDHLWETVQADFIRAEQALGPSRDREDVAVPIPPAPLRRLPAGWSLPAPPPPVSFAGAAPQALPDEPPTFEWVGDTLRHVGTVVHQTFALVAREGSANWNQARAAACGPAVETALRTLGVPEPEIAGAAAKVLRALQATLADERGRWILDNSHAEARSEYPLEGVIDGVLRTVRVDRTFVDEAGVRWIVDFKTSEHAGGEREAFLDAERERYRRQMTLYRTLLARFDSRPIRMGLYFPLLSGWREYLEAATA
jgi:ATP-dependent helicase/nuclease subunit A